MEVSSASSSVKSARAYKNIRGWVHQNIAQRTQKVYSKAIKPFGGDDIYVFNKSHFGKKAIISEIIVVEGRNGKVLNMLSTLMDELGQKAVTSTRAKNLLQKVSNCFEDLKLASYNNAYRKPKKGYSLN